MKFLRFMKICGVLVFLGLCGVVSGGVSDLLRVSGRNVDVSKNYTDFLLNHGLDPDSELPGPNGTKLGGGGSGVGRGENESKMVRAVRQIAVLDSLSCLPRFLCGLSANTREPSGKTDLVNDYGFLMKFLIE